MTQLPPELAAALASNPDLARVNPGLAGNIFVSDAVPEGTVLMVQRGKLVGKITGIGGDKPKRSTPEDDFQQQIIDLAHLNGWRVAHFRSVKVTRSDGSTYWQTPVQADGAGFPDLIMLRGRDVVVVEVKSKSGKCSDKQTEWLIAWDMAGAFVYTWRPSDWPEIERTLARYGREIVEV